ncbi:MAG: sugar transferase [Patescibacteria group bacterium]|nr:sugar transferase [Patescibacteria group bacterium]MDD5294325.1 sugar transferase [Patescibacteria group bacterium]MDD5554148.1 sugar transferase [Patescibacteria group bacterium]
MDNKRITSPKLKRLFDVFFSLVFLIITSPLSVLILLAIFIEHIGRGCWRSPLFYREERISQGKKFNLIKFNIFTAEIFYKLNKSQKIINLKEIERDRKNLVFIGKIIQRVYLDELPQLFNVLAGDLSFVGPRPVNPDIYRDILARGMKTKSLIKAGLTGPYQAHKGESGVNQDKLDSSYINFCRNNPGWKIVFLDIKIILRTFLIIFRAQGI